jgi:hypothetical protein
MIPTPNSEVDMTQEPTQDLKTLAQIVNNSLRNTQTKVAGLRKSNTRLLIASIVCSAATTLVAGSTAAAGPVVGEGIPGWRLACIVAAAFAFISTVSTALMQQLKIDERLVLGNQCVGRLKDLDLAIATGTRPWDEITRDYGDILKTYPEFID